LDVADRLQNLEVLAVVGDVFGDFVVQFPEQIVGIGLARCNNGSVVELALVAVVVS
jgi:hypothetical protein